MNLLMNDVRYEWLDIPLSESEIKARRVEKSKNDEEIQKAKEKVKEVKQQIEEDHGVKDRTEANKIILSELISKKKRVKLKVQIIANEEDACMDYWATENAEGYEAGQVVFSRDMTREEKNQYGIITSVNIRKPYND
jgi:hypothetical protein